MFKMAGNETYFTPVTVEIPDGTGKGVKHLFKVQFKRMKTTELDELIRKLDPAHLLKEEERMDDSELLQQVMVGWEGVLDMEGNPVEFNAETMATFLDIYPVRPTIAGTYFESIKTGKRKN